MTAQELSPITDFIPLFEHAKATADQLGHPHTLTMKEWDASYPPFPGHIVVARFGTWTKFIKDNAGIDADSRAHQRRMDRFGELLDAFLETLAIEGIADDVECEEIYDQAMFSMTGCR